MKMSKNSQLHTPYYCTACGCSAVVETNGRDGITIIHCQNPACSNYYNEVIGENYETAVECWNIRMGVK